MRKCRECSCPIGMNWLITKTVPSGIVQGRLTTSDVETSFIYGCETCSELEKTLTSEQMIEYVKELEDHRDHSRKLYKQWGQEKVDFRTQIVNLQAKSIEGAYLLVHEHANGASWQIFRPNVQLQTFENRFLHPDEDKEILQIMEEFDMEYDRGCSEMVSLYNLGVEEIKEVEISP